MTLVFLLEEASMKEVLDVILPQILLEDVSYRTIAHSGKSDLEASIPKKLKAWRAPDARFIIVRDQDSADCKQVKSALQEMVAPYGRPTLIRIACRELEAWYFGDLNAVSLAYNTDVRNLAGKKKFRNPDAIARPKQELLRLFPKHQQLDGARRISKYMDINNNTSPSFNAFISGVRKFIGNREAT